MKNLMKYGELANRILIAAMFIVAGSMKLFVQKPSGVAGFLDGMGFPIAIFFAWVLILSETLGGLALLANKFVKWATIPLMIIMIVAAFTANLKNPVSLLMHLVVASNLFLFGYYDMTKGKSQ